VLMVEAKTPQPKKPRDFTRLRGLITATDDAFSDETEAEITRLMLGEK